MSLAWATLALILFLLPGVFFFIGLATYERLSREIIRSGVVSEVAMASAIAIAIHTVAIILLGTAGFRLSHFAEPLAEYSRLETPAYVQQLSDRLLPVAAYLAATSAAGFGLGWTAAYFIVCGPLRRLARHKWIYDIADADRKRRYVTAFVMTTMIDESRIIMYRGRVHEIFLGPDGALSYLVLKNCFRYYMTFNDGALITSRQLELFGPRQGTRSADVWDRLFIEGKNIANVLFDSSAEIKGQAEGKGVLEAAFEQALARQAQQRGAQAAGG